LIHQNLESPDKISHESLSNKLDSVDSIHNNSERFGEGNKSKDRLPNMVYDKMISNPNNNGLVDINSTAVFHD